VDEAAQDLGGAVDFLLSHDAVTSSTGVPSASAWAAGSWSCLAAQQGDMIGAAVPFYGVLKEEYPDLSG
jgi:carboxymethylenebutenolidase